MRRKYKIGDMKGSILIIIKEMTINNVYYTLF